MLSFAIGVVAWSVDTVAARLPVIIAYPFIDLIFRGRSIGFSCM